MFGRQTLLVVFATCVMSVANASFISSRAYAQQPSVQEPSAQASLAAGINQARAGDFFRALLTLNDVVSQLSGRPEEGATLARAHAFRALAYLGLNQPERARASAMLALKGDAAIVIDEGEFGPRVVALFAGARAPSVENPEAGALAAEQAGRFQDAFLGYLTALQALPQPPAPADDQRLREKIIGAVRRLDTKPVVPQEARDHLKKAESLRDAAVILSGTTAAHEAAAVELRQAVRIAPWWPDASLQLATVLQKLQRLDEALLNLNLYRLADPEGYAATIARATPKSVAPADIAPADIAPANIAPEARPIAPAVIYVYLPHASRARGRKSKVSCDGVHIANLENGRFITMTAAPGFHSIEFRDRTAAATFETGREHYLRAGIEGFPAHFALHLTDPDKAAAEMREKKVAPNDPKQTFSTECKAVGAVPGTLR